MELNNSPKIFEGYKSAKPGDTISLLEKGFRNIGFEVNYTDYVTGNSRSKIYSGSVILKGTSFKASGKGRTKKLSRASAIAELAERFSAGLY